MDDAQFATGSWLVDERRLRLLERVLGDQTLLSGALDLVTDAVASSLGVPVALVTLVGRERQHFVGQTGLADEVSAGTPLSHSFCRYVVARGEPLIIDRSAEHPLVCDNPAISELGVAAYAGHPIALHGQVIGSLCAIDHIPHAWSDGELEALRAFSALVEYMIEARLATAGRVLDEQAWARAREQQQTARLAIYEALTDEQTTVEALNRRLQRALLPRPTAPRGPEVGVFYRPGSNRLLLGGDFVDTVAVGEDALSFVIGDVTGHGPEAAALAISLRASWHALSMVGAELAQIITVLDGQTAETDLYATLLLGRIDHAGRLCLLSAGHPAPVTLRDSGVSELAGKPGPMLGLGLDKPSWTITEHHLQGETLIAYTDGLVEGHVGGGRERYGVERLLAAIRELGTEPELLCEAATHANGEPLPDDVAILRISFA